MKCLIFITTSMLFIVSSALAADSLSYSGRLVNTNGSPVTGTVNLQFDLGYTTATPPIVNICTQTINNVPLSNGVFHVKLDPACGAQSLSDVVLNVPASESLAIRVNDLTNSKVYSYQALHSMPMALVSKTAKQLDRMGATTNQVLGWDGTSWRPTNAGAGSGTVTSITAGTGLTATATNPITATGTISIANGGVNTTQLADGAVTTLKIADDAVTNAKISSVAGIARSKLATGTANAVIVNNGTGVMSEVATISIAQGGTGANTQSGARSALGLGTAAVADLGYAAGNALPSDNIPVCLPTQKLLFSGVGPSYWSCATDIDTNTDATKLPIDGSVAMTGALDLGNHKIFNVTSPTLAGDAANKAYVDAELADAVASMSASQWITTGANISYSSGNVGIGTTTPAHSLSLLKEGSSHSILMEAYRSAEFHNTLAARAARGTLATPLFLAADQIHGMSGSAWNGTAFSNVAGIHMYANGHSATSLATNIRFYTTDTNTTAWREVFRIAETGNVGVGTTTPANRLDVVGDIATTAKFRMKSDNANYVELRAPTSLASTIAFTFPGTAGASGQALTSDGSGNLTWSTVTTSSSTLTGDVTGTLSTTSLGNNTVTSAKIVDGTITGSDIADGTIPYAKLNIADADIPLAKINGLVAALAGKEPSITAGTSAQYWRGDKTWQTLNTTVVPEGTNLYFLDSRVRAALMSGYTMGTALPLAATDTLIEALGKLEASVAIVQAGGQWAASSGNVYRSSGNVGIGTNSPSYNLHVSGAGTSIAVTDTTTSVTARLSGNNVIFNRPSSSYITQAGIGGNLVFQTSNATSADTNAVTIHSNGNSSFSGNVGIGTSSPSSMLHVTNSIRSDVGFQMSSSLNIFKDGSNHAYLSPATGILSVKNPAATADWLTINNGNVGIGTTTPTSRLTVADGNLDIVNDGSVALGLRFRPSDPSSAYTNTANERQFQWMTSGMPDSTLGYKWSWRNTDGTQRIDAMSFHKNGNISFPTGNVGIGTLTPTTKLEVVGTIKATAFDGPMTSTTVAASGGTAAAPSYSFSGNPNTGFYSSTANTIGVSANGAQVFNFSSAGLVSPTTGGGSVSTANGTAAAPTFSFAGDEDTGWFRPSADTLAAATGGVERVRINTAGNLGIGTNPTLAKLQVSGSIYSAGLDDVFIAADNQTVPRFGFTKKTGFSGMFAHSNTIPLHFGMTNSASIDPAAYTNITSQMTIDTSGNVGIGTTVPSSKLHVHGTVANVLVSTPGSGTSEQSSLNLATLSDGLTALGTAGNLGWQMFARGNAFSTTAQQNDFGLAYWNGTTWRHSFIIDSITGNTGFGGVTNPAAMVDIQKNATAGTGFIVRGGATNTNDHIQWVTSTGVIQGVIDANGMLGLGTGTPAGPIHVVSNNATPMVLERTANLNSAIQYKNTLGSMYAGLSPTGLFGVSSNTNLNTAPYFTVSSTGNVGIGTNQQNFRLTNSTLTNVNDEINTGLAGANSFVWEHGSDSSYGYAAAILNSQTSASRDNGLLVKITDTAVQERILTLNSNNVDRFIVNGAGAVGIGTVNPATTERLAVHLTSGQGARIGPSLNDGSTALFVNTAAVGQNGLIVRGMASQTADLITAQDSTGVSNFRVEVNGNVRGAAFISSSDKRLKKNIVTAPGLKAVSKLRGVEYIWRSSNKPDMGVIAQEVETVFPHAVYTDPKTGMKAVQYNALIAPLIQSTNELKNISDSHSREIASLKKENAELRNDLEAMKAELREIRNIIRK